MTNPLDMPDDYQWLIGASRALLEDQAELAVRMGSIVSFDRRGQVHWMDHGQGGLSPWGITGSGTGNDVLIVADNTYWPGYAIKMVSGSDGGGVSQIDRPFHPQELNQWGVEVALFFPTEFDTFDIFIDLFTGTQVYEADYFIQRSDDGLYIADATLGAVKIATIANPVNAYGKYHLMKLVVDMETKQYVRALYDDEEFDISAYSTPVSAASDTPEARLILYLVGRNGHNDSAVIGHVIVTVGEP